MKMNLFGNRMQFEDGSSLVWADRETLKYEEADRVALVWVDFGPGFFSRTKILRLSSLNCWHMASGGGSGQRIPDDKKLEIIEKVRKYYSNRKVVVDTKS